MRRKKLALADATVTINGKDVTKAFNKILKDDEPKPYEITSASIKEMKCDYGYEIKTGPTAGDKIPTRKGEAIIHDDMVNAFVELHIHLAVSDDAFKHLFQELPNLDELKENDIASEFHVTSFKVKGNDEDEGFYLTGYKYVTLGVMGIDTPKITKSNYKFFDELQEKMNAVRSEVEQYMNGKSAPKDEDNQPELPFNSADEFDEQE